MKRILVRPKHKRFKKKRFWRKPAKKRRKTTRTPPELTLRQINESTTHIDALLKAKKPGKRISNTGKTYYERRTNRSDKNPKKRL